RKMVSTAMSPRWGPDRAKSNTEALIDAGQLPLPAKLVHAAVLHDEADIFQQPDVGCRIALDGDDVGVLADLDRAGIGRYAEQVGGVDGRRSDRQCRLHPVPDHQREFLGVAAVRADAGVGAERDLDAFADGPGETLLGIAGRLARLFKLR